MAEFAVLFTRSGEWEVSLPPDVDLDDLKQLEPVIKAIEPQGE